MQGITILSLELDSKAWPLNNNETCCLMEDGSPNQTKHSLFMNSLFV